MALFRKKTARVVRRGAVEDPQRTGREQKASGSKGGNAQRSKQQRDRSQKRDNRGGAAARRGSAEKRRPRPHLEVVPPPNTARKQMLVRSSPHQTQIVVLEGPILVEHYVARSDQRSLVGNVYLGKVRNVLPGMEAAFVDFGEGKNGVLYAGDVNYDDAEIEGKARRIEMVMKPGDTVLVQVVKDALGHKGARLTNQISLAGRYLVLAPNSDVRGISRRLPDEERRRLRTVIGEVRPKGMGVIVRTAAEGASKEDIQADIKRLLRIWEEIESNGEVKAPTLLHEEPPLVL